MKYKVTSLILLGCITFMMFIQLVTSLSTLDKLSDIEGDMAEMYDSMGN